MRTTVVIILLVLGGAACSISPVISEAGDGGLYQACRRAAKDQCTYVVDAPPSEMDACVAKSTYECVSGSR